MAKAPSIEIDFTPTVEAMEKLEISAEEITKAVERMKRGLETLLPASYIEISLSSTEAETLKLIYKRGIMGVSLSVELDDCLNSLYLKELIIYKEVGFSSQRPVWMVTEHGETVMRNYKKYGRFLVEVMDEEA